MRALQAKAAQEIQAQLSLESEHLRQARAEHEEVVKEVWGSAWVALNPKDKP